MRSQQRQPGTRQVTLGMLFPQGLTAGLVVKMVARVLQSVRLIHPRKRWIFLWMLLLQVRVTSSGCAPGPFLTGTRVAHQARLKTGLSAWFTLFLRS